MHLGQGGPDHPSSEGGGEEEAGGDEDGGRKCKILTSNPFPLIIFEFWVQPDVFLEVVTVSGQSQARIHRGRF